MDKYQYQIILMIGVAIFLLVLISLLATVFSTVALYKLLASENQLRIEILSRQEKNIEMLHLDQLRHEDMTNIALALQDFAREKNAIPADLQSLKNEGYLNILQGLHDPQSGQPYFFKNLGDNFAFCIYMSDRLKGVNTNWCPSRPPVLSIVSETKNIASVAGVVSGVERWIFTILWTLGSSILIYLVYLPIKSFIIFSRAK